MNEKQHLWFMVLACGIPLLIIILLPVLGVKGNFTWLALIIMFALHLLMIGFHEQKDPVPGKKIKKRNQHAQH